MYEYTLFRIFVPIRNSKRELKSYKLKQFSFKKEFWRTEKIFTFALSQKGDVAQLVEQRTENPCVTGSIPVITTS